MVAFSVYKSSKYLFDCVADTGGAQPPPYPTVALDALEALRLEAVDVVKRMDYAEVDKLVACCRQHPPQTMVVAATHGDTAPFQEFAKYLKTRQRAGVAMLPDGRLLVLSPLDNSDLWLRCVVVKARSKVETTAALPITTIHVDEAVPVRHTTAELQAPLPPPAVEQPSEKLRRGRVRSRKRNRTQQGKGQCATNEASSDELIHSNQNETKGAAADTTEELVMLYSLPRIERATRIAQLRQEYEAFNDLHYDVLRKWSKADPDN